MAEEGVLTQIQTLCESYLGRAFTGPDQRLLRRFLSDLQRQRVEDEDVRDNKSEIVTNAWERKEPLARVPLSDAPVVPIVRADSKIYSRVETWAYIAAEANKVPEPGHSEPVKVSAVGDATPVSARRERLENVAEREPVKVDRTGEFTDDVNIKGRLDKWKNAEEGKAPVEERLIPKTSAELPVEVGINDRLDKWKSAEEGKAPVEERIIPKTRADLPVEVGMQDRLDKWKNAEEGKGAVNERLVQKTAAEMPVDVDIGNRLGVWKSAEEGKGAADSKPVQKTTADLPVQVDIQNRLDKWKSAEEGKGAVEERAIPKTSAEIPVEVGLKDRLGVWKSAEEEAAKSKEEPAATGGQRRATGPRKDPITIKVANQDGDLEDVVSPRLIDRLQNYTKVAEENKTAVRNADEDVQGAPKLKDRLSNYSKAAEDKTIDKAAVVVPYEDGYEPPVPAEENREPIPVRREQVKIEGASSLKDRLSNWNEATAEKPVPKTAIDLPDPEY